MFAKGEEDLSYMEAITLYLGDEKAVSSGMYWLTITLSALTHKRSSSSDVPSRSRTFNVRSWGLGGGIPQQAKVHCAQAKRTEKAGWVPICLACEFDWQREGNPSALRALQHYGAPHALLASKTGSGMEGAQYAVLF